MIVASISGTVCPQCQKRRRDTPRTDGSPGVPRNLRVETLSTTRCPSTDTMPSPTLQLAGGVRSGATAATGMAVFVCPIRKRVAFGARSSARAAAGMAVSVCPIQKVCPIRRLHQRARATRLARALSTPAAITSWHAVKPISCKRHNMRSRHDVYPHYGTPYTADGRRAMTYSQSWMLAQSRLISSHM